MQKWDYLTIVTNRNTKMMSSRMTDWNPQIDLKKMGEQGWELISVVPLSGSQHIYNPGNTDQLIMFFKRPKVAISK